MTHHSSAGGADLASDARRVPFAVYVLGFGIFAIVTSEFQVSGMMPVMAADLGVSLSRIGYLVSLYAFAMALGGPLLAVALLKRPLKSALLTLYLIFISGEALGALAPSYAVLAAARLITGAASGAVFGVALAICVQLVHESQRGWAMSIVLAGIMTGTVLGLPMANVIGAQWGWRPSFWATAGIATVGAIITIVSVPAVPSQGASSLRAEASALANARLWGAFATSLLIIGATFAAFTYFIPILKQVAGLDDSAVALLLILYGAATVLGNLVVGKLADRHTLSTLAVGLGLLLGFLVLFALFADRPAMAALSLLGIGLVGVTMNPAMVTRVMRTANGRPLVNTVHTSVITLGIVVGAFLGGWFISAGYGLRAPLWVGAGMALAGLLSLVPEWLRGAGRHRAGSDIHA